MVEIANHFSKMSARAGASCVASLFFALCEATSDRESMYHAISDKVALMLDVDA
jgi:hypothetical protein